MRKIVDLVNHEGAATADQVLDGLHEVMHLLRALQHAALRDAGGELTPLEARALGFFARHPGSTQRDLAQHAGRDKGQVARLVQGLRERGWLEAVADAGDRRVTHLKPTERARRQYAALARQRSALAEAAMADLTARERDQLIGLLARLRARLQALRDSAGEDLSA